jgi:hypothetical protein
MNSTRNATLSDDRREVLKVRAEKEQGELVSGQNRKENQGELRGRESGKSPVLFHKPGDQFFEKAVLSGDSLEVKWGEVRCYSFIYFTELQIKHK